MDIIGIGIDLVRITRIREADQRWGKRFRERVFTPVEIGYALDHASPYPRFAGQFAVKEAVLKAVGTGWREGIRWTDIEISHAPSGAPRVTLSGRTGEVFREKGGERIYTSITHEEEYAVAQVVITGTIPTP